MHPVLFSVPLPHWTIPLTPALLLIAGLGSVVALFGWRKKTLDLLVIGVLAALACTGFALSVRGQTYQLADVPIYSYGAMLCISFVAGWYLTLGLGVRDGLTREVMANCFLVTAVAALVGARLLYVLTNPSDFASIAEAFAMRRGGFVAYGGFIGGFVGSWAYLRRHRLSLLPWADVAVPSLASGLFITRIGCYLFGCDFGRPLSAGAPGWLRRMGTFPRWNDGVLPDVAGSPAWVQHVRERGLSAESMASLPVHPTQIYESLSGLLLLGLVLWLRRYRRFRGEIFLAFTLAYGLLRFLLEIVRDDTERGTWGPALGEHFYVPLMLVGFAAAFAYGPARSIERLPVRYAAMGAFLLPAALAFLALRPGAFAIAVDVQLSTSQWIALATSLAAAAVWERLRRRAEADPVAAMRLDTEPSPLRSSSPASSRAKPRRRLGVTQAETPTAKRDSHPESEKPDATPPVGERET
jgi:phosphatidylglycerol:prolipoprotein diacylglycerol transferase